jgi:2'-5' RNA ligase
MRLFVAFAIPEDARRELRRRVEGVRRELPRARWVDPMRAHLTLAFLGEVEAARRAELEAALADAFGAQAPLEMGLEGGGGFPPGRPARVVWVGLFAAPELAGVQRVVARAAAAAAGVAVEERDYHPHVTLARCDPPWGPEAVERLEAAVALPVGERFVAGEGLLVESRLSPEGARHTVLGRYPLARKETGA